MRFGPIALLVPAVCTAQVQTQPRLVLDAHEFDFGRIQPVPRATHVFRIRNEGGGTLKIIRLNPACGCTTTVLGKDSLEPGETADLEVALNSTGYLGSVTKTIDLVSNDPVAPHQTLVLKAFVQGDLLLARDEVFFHSLRAGDLRKASLKVTSGTGRGIVVTDVDLSDAPWLGVATRVVGKDLFVDFELLASKLPDQRLSGVDSVAVHVLNPRPSTVNLRVRWEKLGPVAVHPEKVVWSEPAGQDHVATVVLRSRSRKPFRILSAVTTQPLLKVLDLPTTAGARQVLRVVLAGTAGAGIYDDKVVLTLEGPGQLPLEIPVVAVLR